MTWLAVPILAAFAVYFFVVIRRTGLLTADSIFVYLQVLMALGSLPILETAWDADRVYGYVLTYTLLAYMLTSAVIQLSWPRSEAAHQPRPTVYHPSFTFWLLALVSAAVVVLYYAAIGYSAFLAGLGNAFQSSSADVTSLRLNSYSGSRYLFPGYVNQFKNALLPALVVLAATSWIAKGTPRKIAIIVWMLVAIFGLIGTGQRGAFVVFIATTAVYLYLFKAKQFWKQGIALALVFIPVIILSTSALGRSADQLSSDESIAIRSIVAADEFRERVLTVNQVSAVVAFRYVYTYEDVQQGREWATSLAGVFPGNRGSDLSSRIFAYRYGSARGTSPPSVWGSIYHNFGYGGIALAPILLAVIISLLSRFGTRRHDRNSLEIVGIAGVFTVIGFWVADSPLYLLNAGLPVYAFLWWWGSRTRPESRSEHGSPEEARRGSPGPW